MIKIISLKNLDKNSAKIKIKYLGKIKNLQNSFVLKMVLILKISNNEWSLTLAGFVMSEQLIFNFPFKKII